MPMQSNALEPADAVTYNANRFASLDHYMRVQCVSGLVEQLADKPFELAYLSMAVPRRLRAHFSDKLAEEFELALYWCALK